MNNIIKKAIKIFLKNKIKEIKANIKLTLPNMPETIKILISIFAIVCGVLLLLSIFYGIGFLISIIFPQIFIGFDNNKPDYICVGISSTSFFIAIGFLIHCIIIKWPRQFVYWIISNWKFAMKEAKNETQK